MLTDEVATIVGDIGADTCKFGYGGEDSPKHVFSSTAGYLPGSTSIKVSLNAPSIVSVEGRWCGQKATASRQGSCISGGSQAESIADNMYQGVVGVSCCDVVDVSRPRGGITKYRGGLFGGPRGHVARVNINMG